MSWCSDAPEDEAISLFAGLLANPDMTLSPSSLLERMNFRAHTRNEMISTMSLRVFRLCLF